MFNFNYGNWNWNGKPQASNTAVPIINQDVLREQLRNIPERKPSSYKSINASSVNIFKNDLNKTEQK
jgi:hypothetical protein